MLKSQSSFQSLLPTSSKKSNLTHKSASKSTTSFSSHSQKRHASFAPEQRSSALNTNTTNTTTTATITSTSGTVTPTPRKSRKTIDFRLKYRKSSYADSATETDDEPSDDDRLRSVLTSISVQSDELLLGEIMWEKRARRKRETENGLVAIARAKNIRDSIPTVEQAKEWADEKEFWLTCIPRQQKIWKYTNTSTGAAQEFWSPIKKRMSQDDILQKMQIDSTGKQIPLSEQCKRFQRQGEWEQKVITDYDKKALLTTTTTPTGGQKRLSAGQSSNSSSSVMMTNELMVTLNRYKVYGKAVLKNVKDIGLDTKSMEYHGGTGNRYHMEQLQRLVDGYNSLKWIYDLNPSLILSLAEQQFKSDDHKCGGTAKGKRWMKLSKSETQTVLHLLDMGKDDDTFCPKTYLELLPASDLSSKSGMGIMRPSRAHQELSLSKISDKKNNKKQEPKQTLRPTKLMPLYVPGEGEGSLKQSVLIRPYTAAEDKDKDPTFAFILEEKDEGTQTAPESKNPFLQELEIERSQIGDKSMENLLTGVGGNPSSMTMMLQDIGGRGGSGGSKTNVSGSGRSNNDEGITIESFVPSYRSN